MSGALQALLEGFAADPVYYISFASEEAFLGGCYVVATSDVDALRRATEQGCNPGGEAMILGPVPRSAIRSGFLDRLITDKDELEAAAAGPVDS